MELYTKKINKLIKKMTLNPLLSLRIILFGTVLNLLFIIIFFNLVAYPSKIATENSIQTNAVASEIAQISSNVYQFLFLLLVIAYPLFLNSLQIRLLRKRGETFSLYANFTLKSFKEFAIWYFSIIPLIGTGAMSIRLYYLLVDIKKRVEKGEIKLD